MSLEKLAISLGLKSSTLKMILTGKRKLSIHHIYPISKKLKLTEKEITYLETLVLLDKQKEETAKNLVTKKLNNIKKTNRLQSVTLSKKELLADPFVLPVMVYLTDIKKITKFDPDTTKDIEKELSQKFKLDEKRCSQILKIIQQANSISTKESSKEVHYIYSNVTNVLNQKQYLKNWLDTSKQEIESRYHDETTFFNTTTLSLTEEQVASLKKDLKQVLEKYLGMTNTTNDPLQLTQVNTQMFSLLDHK